MALVYNLCGWQNYMIHPPFYIETGYIERGKKVQQKHIFYLQKLLSFLETM